MSETACFLLFWKLIIQTKKTYPTVSADMSKHQYLPGKTPPEVYNIGSLKRVSITLVNKVEEVMEADYLKKMQDEFRKSERNVDIPLTLFGNKKTIVGIVSLLGYIRNAINSNSTTKITIEIGKTIENDRFDFLLDGETVPDMKVVENVQIN